MKRNTLRFLGGSMAVSVALLVSACGSSSGSDDASKDDTTTEKTTTTAAEETTTTVADGEAEAQARADSVDLEVSDFPDGWTSSPSTDGDEESPVADCDPALGDKSVQLARHATDDFSVGTMDAGDGTQFAARTVVFTDEAAAEAAVAPFSDPDVIACIDEALKSAYTSSGEDVTVEGTLGTEEADFDVDETAALSATYTISAADGSSLDLNFGVLVLRTGDVVTNVIIQSVDPSLDATSLPVPTLVEELNAA